MNDTCEQDEEHDGHRRAGHGGQELRPSLVVDDGIELLLRPVLVLLLLLVSPRRQSVLHGQVLTWRRLELEFVGRKLLPLLGHSGWRWHVWRWLIGAGIIVISARR